MRAFKRYTRGFTLVELMIVVAIIGVLAALAIYGVRRYLQSAKTSEAKQSIGAIVRGGIGKYERETTSQEVLTEGNASTAFSHDICGGSTNKVPSSMGVIAGKKYQPNSTNLKDFETGDSGSGWKCLKFNVSSPTYFSYGYVGKAAGVAPETTTPALAGATSTATSFLAFANGDLDGDSQYSAFGVQAGVNTSTRSIRAATQIETIDEFE